MKAVIVRYRVQESFIAQNTANIQRVLMDHAQRAHPGVRYFVSQDKEDPQAFVHIGLYADDAAVSAATDLDSFRAFQQALKQSGLLQPPKATWMDPIGAGFAFPG